MSHTALLVIAFVVTWFVVAYNYFRRIRRDNAHAIHQFFNSLRSEYMADLKDPLPGDTQMLIIGDEWLVRNMGTMKIRRARIHKIGLVTVQLEELTYPHQVNWHKKTEVEWIELVKTIL